jgi:uncharacterized membrane protein
MTTQQEDPNGHLQPQAQANSHQKTDPQLPDEAELDAALTPVLEQNLPMQQRAQILRELKGRFSPEVIEAQLIGLQVVRMEVTERRTFSGPLPPPDVINAYPSDVRQSILQMAVKAQEHSHAIQQKALDGAIAKDKRGQYLAFAIAVAALVAAGIVAAYSPVVAGVIAGLDLGVLCAVFLGPRVIEAIRQGTPDRPDRSRSEQEKDE